MKAFSSTFAVIQRVGRSFMLPIAILPIAGVLLGIASAFTNSTMNFALPSFLKSLFIIMNDVSGIIFANLPILFAVGIALGMAKREKEVSALAAVVAFFVFNAAIHGMLVINGLILPDGSFAPNVISGSITDVCGIKSLQTGVFGGIVVGLGVAWLHNRYYKIELPDVFSFFGGTRFVPIISTVVFMFVGILFYFIWPPVQQGINSLGMLITGSGYGGTFLFGLIKRSLIPLGLHHVFYVPFWQTALGGSMEIAGHIVEGGQNIFFAQLAHSADFAHFSADATRYFTGEYIFMIFGLPGAAVAMYRCAFPEKKKLAGGLLLSAALTSALTGITEPIEFAFLFAAPALYVIHVILAAAAYMIAHMLNIAVGLTFSGGILDLIFFGVLQGNAKTGWMLIPLLGVGYFFAYYFIFMLSIKMFNLKTPGREGYEEETRFQTKEEVKAKYHLNISPENSSTQGTSQDYLTASLIVKGLGGFENIVTYDYCATRLRLNVHDAKLIDEEIIKMSGSIKLFISDNAVQIVYGPKISLIKAELDEYIDEVYHKK